MNHRGHLKLGEKAVCMVFWGEFLGGVGEKKIPIDTILNQLMESVKMAYFFIFFNLI